MTTPTSNAAKLWQERYRNPSNSTQLISNPFIEQLLAHRSVRSYSQKPLPEGLIETLLAVAQSASTSSNLQVWSLLVVKDPARKERLAQIAQQPYVAKAPVILIWLADFARIQQRAEQQAEQQQTSNPASLNQQVDLAALDYLDSTLIGCIDAALAAQNAMLAAESLGLGAVYLGSLRNDLHAVISELKLPKLVFPVFGMALGYPDPNQPAAIKPRLPQAMLLHHETYASPAQASTLVDTYDRNLSDFYREQGLKASDWSQHTLKRLRKEAMQNNQRDQLASILRQQGYKLL